MSLSAADQRFIQLPETITGKVSALTDAVNRETAIDELVGLAENDVKYLTQAREIFVKRLQNDTGDLEATAALSLLNAAISKVGWNDPYCWKGRRRP